MDEDIQKHMKTFGPLVGMIALVVGLAYFRQVLVLTILLVLICVVLVISILIQQHRGGGLVGALGGMGGESTFGTSAMPVKKFTAGMGILFMVTVIALGKAHRYTSVVEQVQQRRPVEARMPAPEGEAAPAEKPAEPPKKEEQTKAKGEKAAEGKALPAREKPAKSGAASEKPKGKKK